MAKSTERISSPLLEVLRDRRGHEEVHDELLTAERRAELDARDRSLMERFLAREKAAEQEVVARLDSMGKLVALRFWPRLFHIWEDFRGDYFALLHRYREEGKLRLGESLRFLAQRLLKQSGRKAGIQAHRDVMALSFTGRHASGESESDTELGDGAGWGAVKDPEADEDAASWGEWLEREAMASAAAQPRFVNPEAKVGSAEELAWLEKVKARLSPSELKTLEAELAVPDGEHESLEAALGVSKEVAWQRRSRMKRALHRIAEETGATEILERLEARMQRRKAK